MRTKTKAKTKGLAWLLSLMMIVTLMPSAVFAEGQGLPEDLPFSILIDGAEPTAIVKSENGYIPYEYSYTENDMAPSDPVPLYTVTVPEGARQAEITTVENRLVYNYKDGATYLSGYYKDSQTGGTKASVPIDANDDGAADYIQVQTPFDEDWNSTTLYAITFDGDFAGKGERVFTLGNASADALRANIASGYVQNGARADSNTAWIVTDMMAYQELFPGSANLSTAQRQNAADYLIDQIEKGEDLAKSVLALVSMGYDPAKLTAAAGQPLNGVAALLDATLTEGEIAEAVKSVYSLPWIIIALQQFGATYKDTIEILVTELVSETIPSGGWGYSYEGVDYFDSDGTAYALLALAPYYANREDVKAAVNDAKKAIRDNVSLNENGAVSSWGSASAESTALLIAAMTALGEDPDGFFKDPSQNPVKLSQGLLSLQDSESKGFVRGDSLNPISTEQGFRGLLALAGGTGYDLYDFSGQVLSPVDSSKWNTKFTVVPEDAAVTLTKAGDENEIDPVSPGSGAYLLEDGEYSYTVSCGGYVTKAGTVTVAAAGTGQKVREYVSLAKEKPSPSESGTVDVTVRVLAHDKATCNNTVTYKNDPDKYSSLLKKESYTATLVKNEGTARDVLVEALDDSGITYEEVSNGYFPTIGEYTEFGHGSNSGWLYMVNGKAGTSAMKDVTFSRNGTLTVFFTDDYSKDYGSENWGPKPKDDQPDDPGDDPVEKDYYDDTKGHWAEDAINQITEKGLMKGVAERKFAPDVTLSRAMFVTMLYRLEIGDRRSETTPHQSPAVTASPQGEARGTLAEATLASPSGGGGTDVVGDGEGLQFTDIEPGSWYEEAVTWGVKNGIVKGTSDTTFSPDAPLTREQMAVFLYRYKIREGRSETGEDPSASPQNEISAIGSFTDADQVSSWAEEAVTWAVANGIINGVSEKKLQPKGTATRAQAATILLRYIDKHSL